MSPKQHIKLWWSRLRAIFFAAIGRLLGSAAYMKKLIFSPTPYFYGADPANIKNAVNLFARDVGPQTICMYLSIPSRDILSPKSKYCNGFDVRPHNDWTNKRPCGCLLYSLPKKTQ